MEFVQLNIIVPILKALSRKGYEEPTPIQQQAIPAVLEGKDLIGCAQTGTGKTAAFAIPILQSLHGNPLRGPAFFQRTKPIRRRPIKALVLTPTRELALQIGDSFAEYGIHLGLRHAVIYGGVSQLPQTRALEAGVDILVATPGRLLDLIGQRFVHLEDVSILVLDEADRMLDMGFSKDVMKIIDLLPKKRQTLLFSATMPPEIIAMASKVLRDPTRIEVTPTATTVEAVEQQVYFVDRQEKKNLLYRLLRDGTIESALVFTRTKHGADKVVKDLAQAGIYAAAIHGNKSQNARQQALSRFKTRDTRILVATDIAARGIDIVELSHVINYDIPNVPETYVHRIGRTARAGLGGTAISFCDAEERQFIRDIQKLIRQQINVMAPAPAAWNTPAVSSSRQTQVSRAVSENRPVPPAAEYSRRRRPFPSRRSGTSMKRTAAV